VFTLAVREAGSVAGNQIPPDSGTALSAFPNRQLQAFVSVLFSAPAHDSGDDDERSTTATILIAVAATGGNFGNTAIDLPLSPSRAAHARLVYRLALCVSIIGCGGSSSSTPTLPTLDVTPRRTNPS
jgi:hypothetical protein